jgi:hypothetical protein
MIRVEHTIKILLSESNEVVLTKDQAEQLYMALTNALNKTSSLYYQPNTRNSNNNVLFAGGPIVAQGEL